MTSGPTQQLFVDVTLACSGGVLRAHRLMLSACSSYFRRLLADHAVHAAKHPVTDPFSTFRSYRVIYLVSLFSRHHPFNGNQRVS